jgi:hypothetical protein
LYQLGNSHDSTDSRAALSCAAEPHTVKGHVFAKKSGSNHSPSFDLLLGLLILFSQKLSVVVLSVAATTIYSFSAKVSGLETLKQEAHGRVSMPLETSCRCPEETPSGEGAGRGWFKRTVGRRRPEEARGSDRRVCMFCLDGG